VLLTAVLGGYRNIPATNAIGIKDVIAKAPLFISGANKFTSIGYI